MINWLQLAIEIIAFFSSGLTAVVIVTSAIYKIKEEILESTQKKIESVAESERKEREILWRRFDEFKILADSRYVSKEMCGYMHNDTSKVVGELKIDLKNLGERMEERFSEIAKTMTDYIAKPK